MNSFLQLEDEDISRFVVERQDAVREAVHSKLSTHQFIGDVVELFFPKLADTVTVLLGGDVIATEPNYLTISGDESDESDDTPPPPPLGPGDRDEIIR